MMIVYDTDPPAEVIFRGTATQPGLGLTRGGYRQAPSTSHLFHGDADQPYRIAKVSGDDLATMSAGAIVAELRRVIDEGCSSTADGIYRDWECESHLVAIDELTPRFAGARGRALNQAMRHLAATPSPWGGSYASRVHGYVAPAVHTSITVGRGPARQLGRDGKPHFRNFTQLTQAMGRMGGVWLEMYHGVAGSPRQTPLTVREWQTIPGRFVSFLRAQGGTERRVHFLLTHAPVGSYGCAEPMSCTFQQARATRMGRIIMGNGPGAYRVAEQAEAWLAGVNALFPPAP